MPNPLAFVVMGLLMIARQVTHWQSRLHSLACVPRLLSYERNRSNSAVSGYAVLDRESTDSAIIITPVLFLGFGVTSVCAWFVGLWAMRVCDMGRVQMITYLYGQLHHDMLVDKATMPIEKLVTPPTVNLACCGLI